MEPSNIFDRGVDLTTGARVAVLSRKDRPSAIFRAPRLAENVLERVRITQGPFPKPGEGSFFTGMAS